MSKIKMLVFLLVLSIIIVGCSSQQKVTATLSNNSESNNSETPVYKDNLISLTYQSGGGSSGLGIAELIYKTSKNETKKFTFTALFNVKMVDINNDGIRLIISPTRLGHDMDISNAEKPYWHNIYRFDTNTEQLIYVCGDFPKYYKDTYIPELEKELNEKPRLSPLAHQMRETLINMAQDIVDGKYKPTQSGDTSIENRFNHLMTVNPPKLIVLPHQTRMKLSKIFLKAKKEVIVYQKAGKNNPMIGIIRPEEAVLVIETETHAFPKTGKTLVLSSQIPNVNGIDFSAKNHGKTPSPGEYIYILSYSGEGLWWAWYSGSNILIPEQGIQGLDRNNSQQNWAEYQGRTPLDNQQWIKIKKSDNLEGWITPKVLENWYMTKDSGIFLDEYILKQN